MGKKDASDKKEKKDKAEKKHASHDNKHNEKTKENDAAKPTLKKVKKDAQEAAEAASKAQKELNERMEERMRGFDDDDAEEDAEGDEDDDVPLPEVDDTGDNPLLEVYKKWMKDLAPPDMARVFDPTLEEDRRIELLNSLPTRAQKKYAWAIPDERALRILYHFAPIYEVAAGLGYWGYCLKRYAAKVNALPTAPSCGRKDPKTIYKGFDKHVHPLRFEIAEELRKAAAEAAAAATKGIIVKDDNDKGKSTELGSKRGRKEEEAHEAKAKPSPAQNDGLAWSPILLGGPEVVSEIPKKAALLLCYPDEFEEDYKSVALECLNNYKGNIVILVGESFGQTMGENPWGRSAGDEFQVELAAQFHKILQVPLPSWPGTMDSLSVWKRSTFAHIDEDTAFRHIPPNERINLAAACPAMQSFLSTVSIFDRQPKDKSSETTEAKESQSASAIDKKGKPQDDKANTTTNKDKKDKSEKRDKSEKKDKSDSENASSSQSDKAKKENPAKKPAPIPDTEPVKKVRLPSVKKAAAVKK